MSMAATAACRADTLPKSVRAPEIRLHGDHVTLPIHMVREYPFVEGEVAGMKGKFMLDTGAEQALTINDRRATLEGGAVIGKGFFGSGQTFEIRLRPSVKTIRLGEIDFPEATQVQSQDARLLEHITPDFLGWIGYWFWDGYALKLDYKQSRATFYRGGPDDYLHGEQVVAALPFELRKLPNQPVMHIKIGSIDFAAAFDTGQYGSVYADRGTLDRLKKDGLVTPDKDDGEKFTVTGIHFDNGLAATIPAVGVRTEPFAAAKPIGLTEKNILTVGYGFLKQYKTVWDFKRKTIYLLRP
jgi:hypothetical protein